MFLERAQSTCLAPALDFSGIGRKNGFEEPRATHAGTQLCHSRCQLCAGPALAD